MRLPVDPKINGIPIELLRLLRNIAAQVNGISEGKSHSHHAALTAAPTTGNYAQGDFILNSTPAEAGSAGSKYLVHGWRCTVGGTPGTWLAMRVLTGN